MKYKKKLVITSITYGRTVNVGNYQSVRFDLTAKVEPGRSWKATYKELKAEAMLLHLEADKEAENEQ